MRTTQIKTRFRILPFTNRGGTSSYRVTGTRRNGERIRDNFIDEQAARNRQAELEAEWLRGQTESRLTATRLTEGQVGVAEAAFTLLDNEADLLRAVRYWLKHGRQSPVEQSPTADEAFVGLEHALSHGGEAR